MIDPKKAVRHFMGPSSSAPCDPKENPVKSLLVFKHIKSNMAFKLRLARHGAKKKPFYWIMAADARCPRETGKEKLGTYDPLLDKADPKRVQLNEERIRHWLNCGAQPTDRVRIFLKKAGILPS